MKKIQVILLIAFGFFMIPSITYACGKKSCKKEVSKISNKSCCGQKNDSKDNQGCGGKCGHKGCGCASIVSSGIAFGIAFEITEVTSNRISNKQKFYYPENHLSSGYNFLWLIPKIS
jgi:hypothetical protein